MGSGPAQVFCPKFQKRQHGKIARRDLGINEMEKPMAKFDGRASERLVGLPDLTLALRMRYRVPSRAVGGANSATPKWRGCLAYVSVCIAILLMAGSALETKSCRILFSILFRSFHLVFGKNCNII